MHMDMRTRTGAGTAARAKRAFDGDALALAVYREIEAVVGEIPAMLEADYDVYKAGLGIGDVVQPMSGTFKTEAGKEELRASCAVAMETITSLCGEEEKAAREELTETPDPSALSYAQALSGRGGVTVEEVAEAFERYGDNWTVFQILRGAVQEQRGSGNRDFFRLEPRNTLDNWQLKVKNIRSEAKSFLDYVERQAYRDLHTLERRMEQLKLSLRFIGQGVDNGRALGGEQGWSSFASNRVESGAA